jgi:hypothetical protein
MNTAKPNESRVPAVDIIGPRRAQIEAYYANWVGTLAPELGPAGRDLGGKPVDLASFRGKRVLLFSFDSGNEFRAPDEQALLALLDALDKAIRSVGREKLTIVSFTRGRLLSSLEVSNFYGELGILSDFPVIDTVSTVFRKFNEPYNLMLEPGAILIDSEGILRAFYPHPLTDQQLLDAVALTDWAKPVRANPVEDLWLGKEPPQPTHAATLMWSRLLPGVVGMTGGDWDFRGADDLILAASHELLVFDLVEGTQRHRFSIKDIYSGLHYTLGWARVDKENSAVFVTHIGWPRHVPVIGRDGTPLWTLEEFRDGVDCVAWVDLDGFGEKTLIIGFNGGGGVAAFFDGGRRRWNISPPGNIWTVAGIDATGGRPGLVFFSNGEKVFVVDSDGRDVGTVSTDGHEVFKVAASEIDDAGERQVVSIWPANVGTTDYVVATDLEGNILWKYPVNLSDAGLLEPEVGAVDMTGDGTKNWIVAPNPHELIVLNARGQLVARIDAADNGFHAWTAIESKGKPGWIVTEEAGEISAFTLAPNT